MNRRFSKEDIKVIMRCYFITIRMAIIKERKNREVDEVSEKLEPLCIAGENVNC